MEAAHNNTMSPASGLLSPTFDMFPLPPTNALPNTEPSDPTPLQEALAKLRGTMDSQGTQIPHHFGAEMIECVVQVVIQLTLLYTTPGEIESQQHPLYQTALSLTRLRILCTATSISAPPDGDMQLLLTLISLASGHPALRHSSGGQEMETETIVTKDQLPSRGDPPSHAMHALFHLFAAMDPANASTLPKVLGNLLNCMRFWNAQLQEPPTEGSSWHNLLLAICDAAFLQIIHLHPSAIGSTHFDLGHFGNALLDVEGLEPLNLTPEALQQLLVLRMNRLHSSREAPLHLLAAFQDVFWWMHEPLTPTLFSSGPGCTALENKHLSTLAALLLLDIEPLVQGRLGELVSKEAATQHEPDDMRVALHQKGGNRPIARMLALTCYFFPHLPNLTNVVSPRQLTKIDHMLRLTSSCRYVLASHCAPKPVPCVLEEMAKELGRGPGYLKVSEGMLLFTLASSSGCKDYTGTIIKALIDVSLPESPAQVIFYLQRLILILGGANPQEELIKTIIFQLAEALLEQADDRESRTYCEQFARLIFPDRGQATPDHWTQLNLPQRLANELREMLDGENLLEWMPDEADSASLFCAAIVDRMISEAVVVSTTNLRIWLLIFWEKCHKAERSHQPSQANVDYFPQALAACMTGDFPTETTLSHILATVSTSA